MKLLDLLAKLGILRFGVKSAVYTSGRDRPIEFVSNDVFNAERDLTTLEDVKRILPAPDRDNAARREN